MVDFDALNRAALDHIQVLLERWLPGGKQQGHDYCPLNPTRDDRSPGSFQINVTTGAWIDFATDDKGGDIIALYAYINNCSQLEAARAVAEELGINLPSYSEEFHFSVEGQPTMTHQNPALNHKPVPPSDSLGDPIMPVPEDVPPLITDHFPLTQPIWIPKQQRSRRKTPQHLWPYRDRDGQLIGYVMRVDGGKGKITMPVTWCRLPDGTMGWAMKWFAAPRPLFGLDRLAQGPDCPVLVVEGEKAATAAQRRFAEKEYIVVTSPCGSKAAGKADWRPLAGRRVTIWPDNDDAGKKYAIDVIQELHAVGAARIALADLQGLAEITGESPLPAGYDAADIPAGVATESITKWLQEAQSIEFNDESGTDGQADFTDPSVPPLPDPEALISQIDAAGSTAVLMTPTTLAGLGRLKCTDAATWLRFLVRLDELRLPLRKREFNAAIAAAEKEWRAQEQQRRKRKLEQAAKLSETVGLPPSTLCTAMNFHDLVDQTKTVLAHRREKISVFASPQGLVSVNRDTSGRVSLYPFLHARLKDIIAAHVDYRDGDGYPAKPPGDVVQCIWELPPEESPFRTLQGIATTAMMRPDGSIICREGYDPQTRLYLDPPPDCPFPDIPDSPSRGDIDAALALIKQPFVEFTWTDESSYAHALAVIFTLALRPMIQGPTPMFIISASTAGSGKGLLTDLLCLIGTGLNAAGSSPPATEEEWTKVIPSLLATGTRFILFDNVGTVLSSPSLDCALTMWPDYLARPFGRNDRMLRSPNHAVWIANGNNVAIGGDLTRRCIKIVIEPSPRNPIKPHLAEFEQSEVDLRSWVHANKHRLLGAVLTIARAWVVAGQLPAERPVSLGSFGSWSRIIGGILEFAGIDGFLATRHDAFSATDENDDESLFVRALAHYYQSAAFTTADVSRLLAASDGEQTLAQREVRDALPPRLLPALDKGYGTLTRAVGQFFRRVQGRMFEGGVQLRKAGQDTHRHRAHWMIVLRQSAGMSQEAAS
ncbi:MAG: hypothetical protein ACOCXA_00040 [Planctomycetota bacterium]